MCSGDEITNLAALHRRLKALEGVFSDSMIIKPQIHCGALSQSWFGIHPRYVVMTVSNNSPKVEAGLSQGDLHFIDQLTLHSFLAKEYERRARRNRINGTN